MVTVYFKVSLLPKTPFDRAVASNATSFFHRLEALTPYKARRSASDEPTFIADELY